MNRLFRRLPVTADQLRDDRIVEEALACRADPLHLAAVFGFGPRTGLRYAQAACTPPNPRIRKAQSRRTIREFAHSRPSELLNSRETGLDAFYCQPGIEGAHEKGGVEGQVGYFRRNYLVPVPDVDSLAELNARIDARGGRGRPADRGADPHHRPGLRRRAAAAGPAAGRAVRDRAAAAPRVDRYGQVIVRMNRYSVPVRLIGRQVRVVLRVLGAGHLRRAARGRPARADDRPGRRAAWSWTTTWRR